MSAKTTMTELRTFLEAHPEIESFDLLLPDINGILRGVRAPRADMAGLFETGVYMSASTMLLDSRGKLPEGLSIGLTDGDPDYPCLPVPGTLSPVPWTERPQGQCLLQMHADRSTPYYYDSRRVLQRVLNRFHESGLTPVLALELEFYLLSDREGQRLGPRKMRIPGSRFEQDTPHLHSLDELHDLDSFLADVEKCCACQDIPVGTTMSEGSPGQYEINLHHVADAERACDHAMLLRRLVRGVARRHGMAATFMAQPFGQLDGSGMHVHLSLQDASGQNLFAGNAPADRPGAYAPELRHAVGGLLAALPESQAILAPNANSYRRLSPGSFLTAEPSWGYNHRQVAVRIPPADDANVRLEHRPAGADCNPYLVVAALLAGVHHGLSHRVEPPAIVQEGQIMEWDDGAGPHWEGALSRFEEAVVLPGYLGADFCRTYLECRRLEARHYRAQVPDLDYLWYLGSI
jgi:glutamine synthetase